MAFGDLLKGASDLFNKAKDAIEETTGVDLDGIVDSVTDKIGDAKDFVTDKVGDVTEAVSNPGDLLEKAKDAVGDAKDAVMGKIQDLTGGGDAA
jgi:uncharacterized protein YjbJ (UPF0337 family)